MQMEMRAYQKQAQVQILTPRMIQSMEILQLPIMSLMDRLQAEMEKNPVLELREASDDGPGPETDFKGTDSLPPEKTADPERDELIIDGTSGELDFDRLDALSRDYGDFLSEEHRPSRSGSDEEGDRKYDAMQNMASRPKSLREHLEDQIPFLEATPEQERLIRFLINSYIDRTGYLGTRVVTQKKKKPKKEPAPGKKARKEKEPEQREETFLTITLDEIALSFDEPVTAEQVEEVLHMIQQLDPPGVGARDLKECLLLQVTDETPDAELVRALIRDHLEDIQHNRLMVIQKATHCDLDEIQEAIDSLKHLNPKPGMSFAVDTNRYIAPDIAVERNDDGGYDIRLLDDWIPEIHLSRRYVEMAKNRQADKTTREFLKRKIQDALWLRESIEQRRATLEKVTRAIIEHQKAFLDKGPEFIQPLKMQQIAEQVEVHVTTVSRAVDDKWVQTPRGVFPLKRFFGGASKTESGGEIAWERIKQLLLEMIHGEDKSNPLSDEEIVEKFTAAGMKVARRTVTKYRKMLNIPSSRERRDWTLPATNGVAHNGPVEPELNGVSDVMIPAGPANEVEGEGEGEEASE